MLDIAARHKICEDTIARSNTIATSTPGGSLGSQFFSAQLPVLEKTHPNYPKLTRQPIEVHNSDSFELARILTPSIGKVGVLNLASNQEPGGGWRYTLSITQEEALCYSSTLYATLKPEWYPWPNTGSGSYAGILSPDVVVFRDTLDKNLVEFPAESHHVVAVITVAAPCWPRLTADRTKFLKEEDLHDLREKILLILRMAAHDGITNLVLGAMGCGAYACPPGAVAEEMKAALEMEEFDGWFEKVVFAVYASGRADRRNLDAFQEVFNSYPTTTV